MLNDSNCPFEILANMISGKYKIAILWHLNKDTFKRFSELQKLTHNPSSKVLSSQLRQLEKDGLIYRKVYPVVPPKVEYYISDLGKSLWPILLSMQNWSLDYLDKNNIPVENYIIEEFNSLKNEK